MPDKIGTLAARGGTPKSRGPRNHAPGRRRPECPPSHAVTFMLQIVVVGGVTIGVGATTALFPLTLFVWSTPPSAGARCPWHGTTTALCASTVRVRLLPFLLPGTQERRRDYSWTGSAMCGHMHACCLFYSLSDPHSAILTSVGCLLLLPWFSRGLFQCYRASLPRNKECAVGSYGTHLSIALFHSRYATNSAGIMRG